ncbi:MAG: recombinase family protein [Blastocatellia bacterium]
MKKAIVYCRVSTKGQEEDGSSLDTQESACIAQAQDLGYGIVRVTREVYSGAELWDRRLLARDREDMRKGKADALICYSTDRLSRDPIHLAIIAQELERSGGELHFVSEPLDNTPEGALIRYVKGYAAQMEREKIRERCLRGKRARVLSGKIHRSGTELYGYKRDKEAGVRLIYEPEAIVVRELFEMAVRGDSLRAIERVLNERGIAPPSAGKRVYTDGRKPKWRRSEVRRILTDPAYFGESIAWRWENRKRKIRLRNEGERIRLPEGTTPAIVEAEAWNAVQQRLKSNRGQDTLNTNRPYLLRGWIYCMVCGSRMYSEPEHGRRVYRCSSRQISKACGAPRVPAEDVERDVWSQVEAILKDPEIIAREAKRIAQEGPSHRVDEELKSARKELTRIEDGLQGLVRRYRGSPSDALWAAIEQETQQVEKERTALRARISGLESRLDSSGAISRSVRSLRETCALVSSKLAWFGFEEKRLALQGLVEQFGARVLAAGRDWRLDICLAGAVHTTHL